MKYFIFKLQIWTLIRRKRTLSDNIPRLDLKSAERTAVSKMPSSEKCEQILFSGIEVGTSLSLEIPGVQGRLKSRLIGFEPDQLLIIKLPSAPGIRELLKPGADIVVRFISNGSIIGLVSSIIQIYFEPVGVGFLAFPLYAERISLRKDKRVQCFFSAIAGIEDSQFNGAILDISSSGCRFFVDESQGELKKQASIAKGERIILSIDALGSLSIGGEIANIECESGLYSFGIKFTTIPPDIAARIEGMQSIASRVQAEK